MITEVRIEYFKKFAAQEFKLGDHVVLAGPNNSGKSTLLQALAVWGLCLQRWINERISGQSKAKSRTGIPISRKDFTSIPLREMNLLWTDRDTAYGKEEKGGVEAGDHKLIGITISGKERAGEEWCFGLKLRYQSREQVYVNFMDISGNPAIEIPSRAKGLQIVHIPPFSGIGAEETRYDRGYQNLLVGQGKPGDILRNLLWEVYQRNRDDWNSLTNEIKRLFNCEIVEPSYTEADPFIVIEYRVPGTKTRRNLDLASGGSGFHQVLTLLGFIYARPASVLLVDEPDAHEHVILQRQVYDSLRKVAKDRDCQLIISTHSEVILEDTSPDQITSFYGRPHPLNIDSHRDQVREALKRLSSLDILEVESGKNILYLEDESDFKILSEFAGILGHRMTCFLDNPFVVFIHGHEVREAKVHLFALRAIRPDVRGVLLLDGDNRSLPDHEIGTDQLTILRWKRYEIENYLIHPNVLYRFIQGPYTDLFSVSRKKKAEEFLTQRLSPESIRNPLGDDDYLVSIPASKNLLPQLLENVGTQIAKKDYFQIAAKMTKDEIHLEVSGKLDLMVEVLCPKTEMNND
jgi:predicted ATPase